MWRLVILVVIAWIGFSLVKSVLTQRSADVPKTADAENTENMVKCAHCGVHLPVSEAFLVKDVFYCSKAHLPTPHQ